MAGINIKELTAQNQSSGETHSGPSFISQILNYDIKLFGKSFSDKKKEKFYSQLHLLTMTGVDLRSSLELLTQATKKTRFSWVPLEKKDESSCRISVNIPLSSPIRML